MNNAGNFVLLFLYFFFLLVVVKLKRELSSRWKTCTPRRVSTRIALLSCALRSREALPVFLPLSLFLYGLFFYDFGNEAVGSLGSRDGNYG